jgi:hypothetical protein
MGLDHEADCRTNKQGRRVQKRLRSKLRRLIGRRQAIVRRLKLIDAVRGNQDRPEGSRGAAC